MESDRGPGRRRLALLVAVLAAVAPAGPALAADTQTLTARATRSPRAALAANSRGDAVVAYRGRRNALYVAFASRGGRFGPARRVRGGRIGGFPEATNVAIDERGDALLAWTSSDESIPEGSRDIRDEGCCYRVRALLRRRSGHLTRVRTVNPRGDSASLVGVDAAGGRFGMVWENLEGEPYTRWAVGGRSGRFGTRRAIQEYGTPMHIAVSARRILVHVDRELSGEPGRSLLAVRYAGRTPGAAHQHAVRGTSRIEYFPAFASTVGGEFLGLYHTFTRRLGKGVLSGDGRAARRVRGLAHGRVALASSGRGVVATARRRSIVVRLRRSSGRVTLARRHGVGGTARVGGVAVNGAGHYAVGYRAGRRRLGVLVDGRRRVVRRRGGSFARGAVRIDASGQVRMVFVKRGRVHAWRGRV